MVGIYNMTLFGRFSAFTPFLSEIQSAWVLQRFFKSKRYYTKRINSMDVDSNSESKNAIPTDNSDDEGKGGVLKEKGMVTKMGPRMVMGRTKYRVGMVKAKVKERQRKLLGKSEACLKATKKTRKGGYDATNCSILPLKVSGFMQIKG